MKKSLLALEHELIEKIYSAALNEITWAQLIPDINHFFRSSAGGFFMQDDETGNYGEVLMQGFADGVMDKYQAYYSAINPWFSIPGMMDPNCIRTEVDIDIFNQQKGSFITTEFFNDWMRPYEMDHAIGGSLTTRGSLHLNFTMFRSHEIGEYTQKEITRLHRLFPHLRRSMEINEVLKVGTGHNQMLMHGLDLAGIGLIVLNAQENIVELNSVAETILHSGDGLSIMHRKITVSHPVQDAVFSALLAASLSNEINSNNSLSDWIFVPRISKQAEYQLMLIRNTNPTTMQIERSGAMMVLIIDPTKRKNLPRAKIQQRHSLTDRETDVALLMLEGYSAKKISSTLELSYESTRWYIKRICKKANATSQVSFVAQMLSELSLIF